MKKKFVDRLGEILPKLMKEFARPAAKMFEKGSITFPQMILLESLYGQNSLTMSGIAKNMGITKGAVTGLTDRLVRSHMITRTRSTSDRRVVTCTLTTKGKALVKQFVSIRKKNMENAFSNLTENEYKNYLKLIQKIYEGMAKR